MNTSVFHSSGEVFGAGMLPLGNKTEQFAAFGKEVADKLDINLVALNSDLYRLKLVEKGGSVSGIITD